jgi:hypothetical protein
VRLGTPHYVLVFVVIGLLLGVVWAGSTSTAAFGGYNPAWDGSSDARGLAEESGEVVIVRSGTAYDGLSPENTTAIVLSPEERYDTGSAAAVREFVREGGTLVVAGDFDTGANPLLASVGADSRIDGRVLRDERHHGATPAMPVATNVSEHPYTASVDRLALNYPSVVNPGANASVVVSSSSFGYLDENENEELDDSEELRSYPIVVTEGVGAGRVVVVSDPSLFINTMLEREDNRAFTTNVFGEGAVAFDYSHQGGVPPLTLVVLTLRESVIAQLAVGIGLTVLATLLIEGRVPLEAIRDRIDREHARDTPGLTAEDVSAFIEEEYPDWDDDEVERLSQTITFPSRKEENEW